MRVPIFHARLRNSSTLRRSNTACLRSTRLHASGQPMAHSLEERGQRGRASRPASAPGALHSSPRLCPTARGSHCCRCARIHRALRFLRSLILPTATGIASLPLDLRRDRNSDRRRDTRAFDDQSNRGSASASRDRRLSLIGSKRPSVPRHSRKILQLSPVGAAAHIFAARVFRMNRRDYHTSRITVHHLAQFHCCSHEPVIAANIRAWGLGPKRMLLPPRAVEQERCPRNPIGRCDIPVPLSAVGEQDIPVPRDLRPCRLQQQLYLVFQPRGSIPVIVIPLG